MDKAVKTLWKTAGSAVLTTVLAAVFCMSVYALPADSDYVYASKSGRVWHEFRNCEDLVGYDAWFMTFADYKKEKKNSTQCSKCKNGQELTDDVIGKTYAYEGGFVRKTEMFPELFVGYSKDFTSIGSAEEQPVDQEPSGSDAKADTADSGSKDSTSKNTTTKNTTTKNTTIKNTTTKNATTNNATAKSDGSSSGKDLMTERQRHNKFLSKTNPKRGKSVITPARPKSAGFSYADFGSYNDYNSNNGRGGDFIYLLGTIMTMEPVKQNGDVYSVAMMVNDCDGYQWYMRFNCSKTNYAALKAELTGKQAYIYGRFGGYSGVTDRPMMDTWTVLEVGGKALDLRLFR